MKDLELLKAKYQEIVNEDYYLSDLMIIACMDGHDLGDQEQKVFNMIHGIYMSTDMVSLDLISAVVLTNLDALELTVPDFINNYEQELFNC